MISRRRIRLAAALLIALLPATALAQDFRIYTRLFNEDTSESESAGGGSRHKAEVVARSLSLFHAGKVYDHVDVAKEVIIFDPANRNMMILSEGRSLATKVHCDELMHMLELARTETERYVATLEAKNDPAEAELLGSLKFQLQPNFAEQFDLGSGQLTLKSPFLEYRVKSAAVEDRQAVETYLRYADWVCRLNYVLHPNVLLPDPRLDLNSRLRKRGAMPVEVQLQAKLEIPIRLRAEHQVGWSLSKEDRDLIHHWETLLKSEATRQVPFREYQQAVLAKRR